MSVISREIISDNFLGIDLLSGEKYDKDRLCLVIDRWKYYLINECNAKKGDKIIITDDISVNFLALCFACFELSLVSVIAHEEPVHLLAGHKIVNPKLLNFLPMDITVLGRNMDNLNKEDPFFIKCNFFKENSVISTTTHDFREYNFPEDLGEVSKIRPDENDILMLTTSSGSTGTAKVVQHTHKFFYELCKRNSERFAGNVAHIQNLHHGSSLSVFYLPSLFSDSVTTHYFLSCSPTGARRFVEYTREIDLNHISFPYTLYANNFFSAMEEKNVRFPNLRVSLLSYIPKDNLKYIREEYISEIESIFGSNETAGPVFLSTVNKANLESYDSTKFYKYDEFYHIELEDNNLKVSLPVYNLAVRTNDLFDLKDGFYKHLGRSDLLRINDVVVNLNSIDVICKNLDNNILIVTDTIENKLYLLIQKNSNLDGNITEIEKLVSQINNKLFETFNSDRVVIDKYLIEDVSKFITGIKIDRELIREYFRNHV